MLQLNPSIFIEVWFVLQLLADNYAILSIYTSIWAFFYCLPAPNKGSVINHKHDAYHLPLLKVRKVGEVILLKRYTSWLKWTNDDFLFFTNYITTPTVSPIGVHCLIVYWRMEFDLNCNHYKYWSEASTSTVTSKAPSFFGRVLVPLRWRFFHWWMRLLTIITSTTTSLSLRQSQDICGFLQNRQLVVSGYCWRSVGKL